MVDATTGKRKLVDRLAAEGVSISYDRAMNWRRSIFNHVCMEYKVNSLVCLVILKKNVFTAAAIDNLYHNPSSATAESSFHGTNIPVFQHADYLLSLPSFRVNANNSGRRKQGKFQHHTQIFSQQFRENQNHQFPLTLIQFCSSWMDLHLHTLTNGC